MKNLKIPAVVLIILFLMIPAYAKPKQQQSPAQPVFAETIVAKMKTQLQLTDQQAADVKPIIENYLAQEKRLKLEEKKQLSKVLTGQQLFTWNFLQNEPPQQKKKKGFLP